MLMIYRYKITEAEREGSDSVTVSVIDTIIDILYISIIVVTNNNIKVAAAHVKCIALAGC